MRKSARDIIKNNLGQKVRELRLSLNMSQADLKEARRIQASRTEPWTGRSRKQR